MKTWGDKLGAQRINWAPGQVGNFKDGTELPTAEERG